MKSYWLRFLLGTGTILPVACAPIGKGEQPSISSLREYLDESCGTANTFSMTGIALIGSSPCGRFEIEVKRNPGIGYRIRVQLKPDIANDLVMESAEAELDTELRTQSAAYSSVFENILITMHRNPSDNSYLVVYRSASEETLQFTPASENARLLPLRAYQALITMMPTRALPLLFSVVHSRGTISSLRGGITHAVGNLEFERMAAEPSEYPAGIGICRDGNGEVQSCSDCTWGLVFAKAPLPKLGEMPIEAGREIELRAAKELGNLLQNPTQVDRVRISEQVCGVNDPSVNIDSALARAELASWVAGQRRIGFAPDCFNASWVLTVYEVSRAANELWFKSHAFPSARFQLYSNGAMVLTAISIPDK